MRMFVETRTLKLQQGNEQHEKIKMKHVKGEHDRVQDEKIATRKSAIWRSVTRKKRNMKWVQHGRVKRQKSAICERHNSKKVQDERAQSAEKSYMM